MSVLKLVLWAFLAILGAVALGTRDDAAGHRLWDRAVKGSFDL